MSAGKAQPITEVHAPGIARAAKGKGPKSALDALANAINLAHDIITGKKTVEQARTAYGDIVKEKMNGQNPAYMQKLSFTAQTNTTDPDKNTTGLTKEDVAKGIRKTAKN